MNFVLILTICISQYTKKCLTLSLYLCFYVYDEPSFQCLRDNPLNRSTENTNVTNYNIHRCTVIFFGSSEHTRKTSKSVFENASLGERKLFRKKRFGDHVDTSIVSQEFHRNTVICGVLGRWRGKKIRLDAVLGGVRNAR